LQQIGAAYTNATYALGRPPRDLQEFLPYLREQGAPDKIRRSPCDGEEFVIVWGVDLRMLQARGNDIPILAYERQGQDGKRHVLRGRSEVLLFTEDELKSAVLPADHPFPF
jgi:hypothetical protein